MARVQFGRSPTVRGYNPMENTLKPGYIIKLRGKFYAVDSVEGLTYERGSNRSRKYERNRSRRRI